MDFRFFSIEKKDLLSDAPCKCWISSSTVKRRFCLPLIIGDRILKDPVFFDDLVEIKDEVDARDSEDEAGVGSLELWEDGEEEAGELEW